MNLLDDVAKMAVGLSLSHFRMSLSHFPPGYSHFPLTLCQLPLFVMHFRLTNLQFRMGRLHFRTRHINFPFIHWHFRRFLRLKIAYFQAYGFKFRKSRLNNQRFLKLFFKIFQQCPRIV